MLNVVCGKCKGKHHSAICNNPQGNLGSSETQGTQVSGGPVGNSMHIGTGNSVALQTAQAQVVGKGTSRVRVLYDSASHKSFVTSLIVKLFGLEHIRREWLTVNTFGQRAVGSNLREVVRIDLIPVGGGKVLPIEAFVAGNLAGIE